MVHIDYLLGIEESDPHDSWKRTFPGIVELGDRHSALCLSVFRSTLDSAPELAFSKRGSPSTVSAWSLEKSSRLSSSCTLRNINFAYYSPYAGLCVNYGLPVLFYFTYCHSE